MIKTGSAEEGTSPPDPLHSSQSTNNGTHIHLPKPVSGSAESPLAANDVGNIFLHHTQNELYYLNAALHKWTLGDADISQVMQNLTPFSFQKAPICVAFYSLQA